MLSPADSESRRLTLWQLVAVAVVFLLAFASRIVLGWANPGLANDNHVEVIEFILRERQLPARAALWEAYHPKLFPVTVALLVELFSSSKAVDVVRWAQMTTVAAGCVTVTFIWLYLRRRRFSFESSLFAFSLVALNPRFIGVGAQPTNDAFVIMLATAAIFFGASWFSQRRSLDFVLMALSTAAAGVTKGNGLVVVVVFSFLMLLECLVPHLSSRVGWRHSVSIAVLASFLLVVFFVFLLDGTYFESYYSTGAPFTLNVPWKPWPPLLDREPSVPGSLQVDVMTVADAFLTFPLVDMVRAPFLMRAGSIQTPSLWAHLYGHFYSLQFFSWPPGWVVERELVLSLGRALVLAGLLPSCILIGGFLRSGQRVLTSMVQWHQSFHRDQNELLEWWVAGGYIILIMLYTLQQRELQAMKVVYILPGVLAFSSLYARELENFRSWFVVGCWRAWLVRVPLSVLLGLYMVDVAVLIAHLR